jgi:fructuronate reductase
MQYPVRRLRRDNEVYLPKRLSNPAWRVPEIGIVHLGLGNFHRAHQAVFTEDAMIAAGGDWGICGVIMRGDRQKHADFNSQGGLYTLLERSTDRFDARVIRSVCEVLAAPQQLASVLERLCDTRVKIVSLTITEKGYCVDPVNGGLDTRHRDIVHDLAHPDAPISAPGMLVAALRRRPGDPFTVMSCDNLSENGRTVKKVVVQFARLLDADLGAWIEKDVAFPCTMVDRITPATTPIDLDDAQRITGMIDALPVSCEPFRQWVIEDTFPSGRPAWDRVGAQLVEDVTPFELAKLRMLNGAHSTIAYLSVLSGYETVAAAMSDPDLKALIHALLTDEIMPTLPSLPTLDLAAYRDALLARFSNVALAHRCMQIATDGSKKIPQRLLAPIAERIRAGTPFRRLALGVAAWMRFIAGSAQADARYTISDPLSATLTAAAVRANGDPQALVAGLLAMQEIFPAELASERVFVTEISAALHALNRGVGSAMSLYK